MKKILITGAGGFIGSHLLNFLKKKNLKVFGTINAKINFNVPKKNSISKKIVKENIFKIDLANSKAVRKIMLKINPNIIYHFAAIADHNYSEKNKKLCKLNNSNITKNIIKYMPKDSKLIFLSSDKLYYKNPNLSPEHTNLKPIGYLAKEKLKSEKYIIKKINKYFILRLPIVHKFGESNKFSAIDNFLWSIKNKKKVKVFDNVRRSFLDITQFIIFLEKLIESKNYGIYNVGSKLYSYAERVKYLCGLNKINFIKKIIKTEGKIYPLIQKFNTVKVNKKFNFFFR